MGLRFVLGRSGIGKTTYMLNEIKKRVQDNETSPVVLLVPEQYSFEMEKNMSRLFQGEEKDKYLRSRVLSFKTMSSIVFSKVGGLTDVNINSSGRAMIIYKSIDKISNELKVYGRSATQSGFVGSITDMISELKQYNVSPEMLENMAGEVENETLRYKLMDIAKIYNEFEKNLHENYVDSQDVLTSLAEKLERCDYFKDAYIYIDEFTGFTPNQYGVLRVLLKQAKEVYISLTIDSLTQFTYSKNDAFSRTKYTFEKLYKLAAEEGVKIHTNVNLNTEKVKRFEGNEELQHLEAFYHAYPYRKYEKETKHIKIKEFNNLYDEVEQVAKEIVHIVRSKKARYKDITVATRDLNRYDFLVKSIFKEYEIPNFIDSKREAKSNPIIVLILSALEMRNRRYSYETMFRYLKSGLIGVSDEDISLLENYVLQNGIKGKKWFEEKWEYKVNPNYLAEESEFDLEQKAKINETKDKVLAPIIKLQDKLKKQNKTVREICTYVYEFLLDINIEETLENLINNFNEKGDLEIAKEYSQVWQIVVDILDQMVELMGDEKISLDKFMKVISLGFDEYELGLVPPSMDQVLVSSIDRMKNSNTKYLYLIGTTDGIFPLISKESGLLTDKDREIMGEKGVEVDIDSKTKTYEEQFLVYKSLTYTSENLIISYPISDHEGKTLRPSIIISRLKKIFPNINMKSYVLKDLDNSDETALDNITVKAPTFNELINAIKEFEIRGDINNVYLDLYRYFLSDEEYKNKLEKVVSGLSYTNQVEKVESEKIKQLYENKNLSISKLERYAGCPFSYFIQYGLKAQERREYSFTAPDLGSFIHNILDIFSKSLNKDKLNWHEIDEDYIKSRVSLIVDEMVNKIPGFILNSSERYKYLAYRLKKMLVSAISIISMQIKQGNFEPVDYEVSFRKNGKYPPIKIVLNDGQEITLVGQIDRIDELEKDDTKYIRIIDYKSGDKSLNLIEIYRGLSLQLVVYMNAATELLNRNSNKEIVPAGILYYHIDDPIVEGLIDEDSDSIADKIKKQLKMKGLVNNDENVYSHIDKDFSKTSDIIPVSRKADGTLSKNSSAIASEEFDTISKYVNKKIISIGREILDGNIKAEPHSADSIDDKVCAYCPYTDMCKYNGEKEEYGDGVNKDNVLDMMKEVVSTKEES